MLFARYSFHIDKYVMHPSWKVLPWWIIYHLIETEWMQSQKSGGSKKDVTSFFRAHIRYTRRHSLELWIWKTSTNKTISPPIRSSLFFSPRHQTCHVHFQSVSLERFESIPSHPLCWKCCNKISTHAMSWRSLSLAGVEILYSIRLGVQSDSANTICSRRIGVKKWR